MEDVDAAKQHAEDTEQGLQQPQHQHQEENQGLGSVGSGEPASATGESARQAPSHEIALQPTSAEAGGVEETDQNQHDPQLRDDAPAAPSTADAVHAVVDGDAADSTLEADQLLERASELMTRHGLHRDHRSAEHLSLAPEALECLKTVLPLLNDKKRHDKNKVLTIFQLCEETVLGATDDCSGDDDSNRRTLGLARGLLGDMLEHPRLTEVRTSNCRQRLDRYVREIDELLAESTRPQPHRSIQRENDDACAARDAVGNESGIGGVVTRGGPGLPADSSSCSISRPVLRVGNWDTEERVVVGQFCEQRFMQLQPTVSEYERVEAIRQHAEWALRQRFFEGRVFVFGSSAMNLCMPESDIDLTLHLPSRMKLIQELRESVESKTKATAAAEESSSDGVRLLQQRAAIETKLSRLQGSIRSKKNDLDAMRHARDRTGRALEALREKIAERQEIIRGSRSGSGGGGGDDNLGVGGQGPVNVGRGGAITPSTTAPEMKTPHCAGERLANGGGATRTDTGKETTDNPVPGGGNGAMLSPTTTPSAVSVTPVATAGASATASAAPPAETELPGRDIAAAAPARVESNGAGGSTSRGGEGRGDQGVAPPAAEVSTVSAPADSEITPTTAEEKTPGEREMGDKDEEREEEGRGAGAASGAKRATAKSTLESRASKKEEKSMREEEEAALVMERRLAVSERGMKATSRSTAKMEEDYEERKREFEDWKRINFEEASPEKKKAMDAIRVCRASLENAQKNLKSTGKIVFEMKRVIERKGFTNVFALHRSRVPVVKTCAPQHLWGPTGQPVDCDISVNNLVAVHNTRLVKAYTDLDPRCHRLLYLVKDWSKARGVNDSSKGTLSSYGHCVSVLHYLIRVGVVPSLLQEHRSLAKQGDRSERHPGSDQDPNRQHQQPLIIDGIDVSFSTFHPGALGSRPLPLKPPGGVGRDQRPAGVQQGEAEESQGRLPASKGDADSKNSGCGDSDRDTDSPSLGEILAAKDAGVCDLLLGYFRYFAEEFRHAKQVMTLRPKGILNKSEVWSKPKLWRTSVEDPFETFDSPNPHDLGWVLSRAGQALLHVEWKRGYDILKNGGSSAVEQLLTPRERVVKDGPKNGFRQGGGGNRRSNTGFQGGGGGGRGAGRLWSPGDGQRRGQPAGGRVPPPPAVGVPNRPRGIPFTGGRAPAGLTPGLGRPLPRQQHEQHQHQRQIFHHQENRHRQHHQQHPQSAHGPNGPGQQQQASHMVGSAQLTQQQQQQQQQQQLASDNATHIHQYHQQPPRNVGHGARGTGGSMPPFAQPNPSNASVPSSSSTQQQQQQQPQHGQRQQRRHRPQRQQQQQQQQQQRQAQVHPSVPPESAEQNGRQPGRGGMVQGGRGPARGDAADRGGRGRRPKRGRRGRGGGRQGAP